MFAIAPYLVQVKDENHQEVDLWNFYSGNNLRDVMKDYYKSILNTYTQAGNQKMFRVPKLCGGTATSLAGIYQTGEYGRTSEIYSTGKKKVAHNRLTDEADMVPFYFSCYFPKDVPAGQRKRGILLLARWKMFGIRQLAIPHLQHYFQSRFPKFSLKVERVVPQIVMETIMKEGALKTIRLVKKSIPKDISDLFSDQDRDKVSEVEFLIRTKRKSVFTDINWLHQAFTQKKSVNEIVTLGSFPKPDKIKLEVMIGKRMRTLDLGSPGKVTPNIDISDIKQSADGHPVLKDWLKEADDFASAIAKSFGMGTLKWNSSA